MKEYSSPFDVERWQPVQDALTEVLGLNIGLVDLEGRPLTRSIDVLRAPWNILTSSPRGFSRYAECLQTLLLEARNRPRPLVFVQVAGLHLCAVPLEREQQIVAYFVLGPCLVGRRGEPDDYIALAKEFDIRIDQWMEALQEIKIFSFVGLNAVAFLLHHLGELAFAASPDAQKEKAVLEHLLDIAIHAVDAQAGSILVKEQASNDLVIQAARGLKPDVVQGTRVRLGEGVAGVVAQEQLPMRVNAKTTHPRIQGALHRPELQDAMVVPMLRGSQLLGVLCVSTSRAGRQFRDDNLDLLKSLAWLAQQALS